MLSFVADKDRDKTMSEGLKDTYNKIARDWHTDHQKDSWWIDGTNKFVDLLKKGGVVLDVGCAGGYKSRFFLGKGFEVVGIDFSQKLIEIANQEIPQADFRVLDMRKVGTMSEEFDGIFASATLLHIPKNEIPYVLKGFVNRLAKGGCLYVAVKENRSGSPDEEIKQEDDYGYKYERFFSYFSADELHNYLKDAGLEIVYESKTLAAKTYWLEIVGRKS